MFTDEDDKARKKRLKTQGTQGAILSGGKVQSVQPGSQPGTLSPAPNPGAPKPSALKLDAPKLNAPKPGAPKLTSPKANTAKATAPGPLGSPVDATGRMTRTPAPVVAAVERGDKLGAEPMSPMDVALGFTKNKLDLARSGKGRLGGALRKRFEDEGYRFG